MAMKKVPLQSATLEQLREYGVSVCGLDIGADDSAEDIRSAIALAQAGITDITVSADLADEPGGGGGKPAKAEKVEARAAKSAVPKAPAPRIDPTNENSGAKDRKIRIIIQNQEGAGGSDPVPVGVNGTVILIPREKPVEVPARYVDALMLAQRYEYSQDEQQNLIRRKVLQYPFTLAPADFEAA